jgi:hypothetical protein
VECWGRVREEGWVEAEGTVLVVEVMQQQGVMGRQQEVVRVLNRETGGTVRCSWWLRRRLR